MSKKILVYDRDLESDKIDRILALKLNNTPIVNKVADMISFKESLATEMYDGVIINFYTPDLWQIKDNELKPLLDEVRSLQSFKVRIIAVTSDPEAREQLQKFGLFVMKKDYGMEQFSEALGIISKDNSTIGIQWIQDLVAAYFHIPSEVLPQKTRKREIVQTRQLVMYLSKIFTTFSLKTIGEHFGGRDHTTVIHAIQTIKDLRDTDSEFNAQVAFLLDEISSILLEAPATLNPLVVKN